MDIKEILKKEKEIKERLTNEIKKGVKVYKINNNGIDEKVDSDEFFYNILNKNKYLHKKTIETKFYYDKDKEVYKSVDETIYPYGEKLNFQEESGLKKDFYNEIILEWAKSNKLNIEKFKELIALERFVSELEFEIRNIDELLELLGLKKHKGFWIQEKPKYRYFAYALKNLKE